MGQRVSSLLNEVGVGIGIKDGGKEKKAPLLEPAMSGDLSKVKELIGMQISPSVSSKEVVDVQDSSGNAAIHGAVYANHLEIVKFLVDDCNADYQCSNGLGCSPLWLAAGYGHEDVMKYLLDKVSCSTNNFIETINMDNSSGDSPLIAAASRGHVGILDIILRQIERIDSESMELIIAKTNNSGDTALSVASGAGEIKCVDLLINWGMKMKEGADIINLTNKNNLTPLLIACERGHADIAIKLVESGASPIKDKNGASPFSVAAFCGCTEVVEKLLHDDFGKRLLNTKDDAGGCTPLWLAARTGNRKMVNILLQSGADLTIANNDGLTPLKAAEKYSKQDVIDEINKFEKENNLSNNVN